MDFPAPLMPVTNNKFTILDKMHHHFLINSLYYNMVLKRVKDILFSLYLLTLLLDIIKKETHFVVFLCNLN